MSIDIQCPACDGEGNIYTTAPRYHSCDQVSKKCGNCNGKGSADYELLCVGCDEELKRFDPEDAVLYCSAICRDSDFNADVKARLEAETGKLREGLANAFETLHGSYREDAQHLPNGSEERYRAEGMAIAFQQSARILRGGQDDGRTETTQGVEAGTHRETRRRDVA